MFFSRFLIHFHFPISRGYGYAQDTAFHLNDFIPQMVTFQSGNFSKMICWFVNRTSLVLRPSDRGTPFWQPRLQVGFKEEESFIIIHRVLPDVPRTMKIIVVHHSHIIRIEKLYPQFATMFRLVFLCKPR